MPHRFSQYILILSLFAALPASAQTVEPLRLDRPQAVSLALSGNKSLQAARTTIEQAQARRAQAGRLDNPEASLEHASDWAFNNEGESSTSLGFAQRFPVTNRLRLLRNLAAIEIAVAEAEVRDRERLLIRDVELTCIELASLSAQLELRRSLIELNEEFAAFIESRIRTGEASSFDANQIKIELYAAEQEVHRLKSDYASQLTQLRRLLGLEPGTAIVYGDTLGTPRTAKELPAYRSESLANHPAHRVAQLLQEIAAGQTAVALAGRWEDITVALSYEDERSMDEPFGIGKDRFFGMSVSVPLPVRGRQRAVAQERLAAERKAALDLDAVALEIRSAAESFRQQAASYERQIRHYEENVTALVEQNLSDLRSAYGSGLISLTELFRSQEQRLQIQTAHVSLIRDYEQALASWRAATARNLAQP